jgi:protein NrfD
MTALTALTELTVSRHNPLVDPHLHIWEWQIPVYLFFGGLVAGLMIIAGVRLIALRPQQREALVCCTIGPLIGLVFLSLGMFTLFLDLSHKLYVWRLYATFQITSPMSWGSWIFCWSIQHLWPMPSHTCPKQFRHWQSAFPSW